MIVSDKKCYRCVAAIVSKTHEKIFLLDVIILFIFFFKYSSWTLLKNSLRSTDALLEVDNGWTCLIIGN